MMGSTRMKSHHFSPSAWSWLLCSQLWHFQQVLHLEQCSRINKSIRKAPPLILSCVQKQTKAPKQPNKQQIAIILPVSAALSFCLLFVVLATPCSLWNLSPWTGTEPVPPALGGQSLNHWTTNEVPDPSFWLQCLNGWPSRDGPPGTVPVRKASLSRSHCTTSLRGDTQTENTWVARAEADHTKWHKRALWWWNSSVSSPRWGYMKLYLRKAQRPWDFSGSPVIRTPGFHCGGPWWGN